MGLSQWWTFLMPNTVKTQTSKRSNQVRSWPKGLALARLVALVGELLCCLLASLAWALLQNSLTFLSRLVPQKAPVLVWTLWARLSRLTRRTLRI